MAKNKELEKSKPVNYTWALGRISIGFLFLWTFYSKLRGDAIPVGNCTEKLCADGILITQSYGSEYLSNSIGPFAEFYQSLALQSFVDPLFMAGLAGVGIALILGIGVRIAVVSGVVILLVKWSAMLPPEHNPLINEDVVYSIFLIGLLQVNNSQVWGFGRRWSNLWVVKKLPFLR